MRYIELVNSIEARLKSANGDKDELEHAKGLCQAEICAWSGDYQEAAKTYARMGEVEKAINLFVDLRQWDEAKVFAQGNSSIDSKDLTRRQVRNYEDEAQLGAKRRARRQNYATRSIATIIQNTQRHYINSSLRSSAR